ELKQTIAEAIPRPSVPMEVLVPYAEGDVVARLHAADAEILTTSYQEEGTRLSVKVGPALAADLASYQVEDS
ncbi:MAG: GTPase HflX, partial [Nesterenkonia sp.]